MKKILIILTVFFFYQASAQLDALSKFHLFNAGSINPAYSSTLPYSSATLYHRAELMGFDGNPVTSTFSYNSFLFNPNPKFDSPKKWILRQHFRIIHFLGESNFGLGLNFKSDGIGATTFYDYSLDLSYSVKLSETIFMGVGLRGSVNNLDINYQSLNLYNQGDIFFQNNIDRAMLANIGFGISIFNESFNISLSMPYMVKQYHYDSYARDNTGFEASSIDLTYLSANATIELNPKINIRPYILVKSSSYIDTQTDVSIIAETKNLDFGFSHRFDYSSALYLGIKLSKNIIVSYSYDLPSNNFEYYKNGAHEFGLRFNFISKLNNVFNSKDEKNKDPGNEKIEGLQ